MRLKFPRPVAPSTRSGADDSALGAGAGDVVAGQLFYVQQTIRGDAQFAKL